MMAGNKEQETFKCNMKVVLFNGEVEDKNYVHFRIILKEGSEPLIWIGILTVLSFCGILGVYLLGRFKRRKPICISEEATE